MSQDANRLYLRLQTSVPLDLTWHTVFVYINADNNASSGYSDTIGADFSLASGVLQRFTGANSSDWSWAVLDRLSATHAPARPGPLPPC